MGKKKRKNTKKKGSSQQQKKEEQPEEFTTLENEDVYLELAQREPFSFPLVAQAHLFTEATFNKPFSKLAFGPVLPALRQEDRPRPLEEGEKDEKPKEQTHPFSLLRDIVSSVYCPRCKGSLRELLDVEHRFVLEDEEGEWCGTILIPSQERDLEMQSLSKEEEEGRKEGKQSKDHLYFYYNSLERACHALRQEVERACVRPDADSSLIEDEIGCEEVFARLLHPQGKRDFSFLIPSDIIEKICTSISYKFFEFYNLRIKHHPN